MNKTSKSLFILFLCAISILFFTKCSGEMSNEDILMIFKNYSSRFGRTYSLGGYRKAKKRNLKNACSEHGFTVKKFFEKYNNGGEKFLRRYYKRKYNVNVIRELPGRRYSGHGYRL